MSDTRIPAESDAGALFDVPPYHEVKFERTRDCTRFRALCSCGWARSGPASDEQTIRNQAATHDFDWVPALNAERVQP